MQYRAIIVLLTTLPLACGEPRAIPAQPDAQPGVDGCGCDVYQGQFDLSVAPDLDPVYLDLGVDQQTCPPLPSCNWCGGSANYDANGCTTGWTCDNGVDPCSTPPCSTDQDCLPTETCLSDMLCWPSTMLDAGVAP